MRALDRKLLRDLKAMRGMAAAIALVMACGVAMFVMYLSTRDSLQVTQESFYRDYRFAEVFADATIAWPLLLRAVMERMDRT